MIHIKNRSTKKDFLHRMSGGVLIFIFLILIFIEYKKMFYLAPNSVYTERYIDFSILLYLSRWIIYFLLFLAGIYTFFKAKKTYLFLLIFSLTSILEIYINETFYIVKSIENFPKYILLGISIASIIVVSLNLFKIKKINFTRVFLSIILAMVFVYLPNALITFYF